MLDTDRCWAMPSLTGAIFVGLMGTAMIWDIRTKRIPNGVIGVGLVFALTLHALSGFGALALAVFGAGAALVIGFSLFALGAIGGGDAKLFMVVGAFMGPATFLYALLASAIAGGVLAVALAVQQGVLLPMLVSCKDLIFHGLTFGRHGGRPKLDDPGTIAVPYGVAIALGSIATWFLLPPGI